MRPQFTYGEDNSEFSEWWMLRHVTELPASDVIWKKKTGKPCRKRINHEKLLQEGLLHPARLGVVGDGLLAMHTDEHQGIDAAIEVGVEHEDLELTDKPGPTTA